MKYIATTIVILTLFISLSSALAQNKVVVVPLGGTEGNAVPRDVVKGRTFSSKAGKGLTGTLELPPCARNFTNTIGMTFNLIPAGTFTMGSPLTEPSRESNEIPHQVTLTRSFYMQTTEVTQKQWQDVIGNNPAGSNMGDDYPIETVNWFEAAYYANTLSQAEGRSQCYTLTGCSPIPGNDMECTGAAINSGCNGYRLPTEAEWEYAARAGTATAFANPVNFDESDMEMGDGYNVNLHAMGWYSYNNSMTGFNSIPAYISGTKPVAQKQANRWGLYDMHGNVYEWCQDWYNAYPTGTVIDPLGPPDGLNRIIRGGVWNYGAFYARSAFRNLSSPGLVSVYVGFRLVLNQGQ